MPFIKHVFKYQEYRKTQFLNTMTKDDLGRHRGGVLYGMKLIPKGGAVHVDAGALYTPYGSKIFWDARPGDLGAGIGVVDLSAVLFNGIPVLSNTADRPIIVAIVAQFPADMQTAADTPPRIEGSDDLAGATPPVTFSAYASSYQQDTARPGFNLFAHHPLELAASGVPGWSITDAGSSGDDLNTAAGAAQRPASSPGSLAAVHINQVLIGYIIIGGTVAATPLSLGTDVWAAGVSYVPVKNPWQTLQSLLGFDPLMGRTSDLVDGGVADTLNPATDALAQEAVARKMATGASFSGVPLGVPRYGTTSAGPGGFDPTWSTYRFPNFLRDGDSILTALQRMDYLLRLWMDKTGDQGLLRSVQDGLYSFPTTYLSRFSPLEGVLHQMGGKVTGNNLNTANWGANEDLPLNADPFAASVATVDGDTIYDHVLKSGVMTHIPQQLNITTMGIAGDSHRQAIRALDWSMFHFLKDILGLDIRRSWLRLEAPWGGGQPLPAWIDQPAGVPVDNTGQPNVQSGFPMRPTIFVSGSLGGLVASDFNLYLGLEKIKAAIELTAVRSSSDAGPNLLKNSVFAKQGLVANPGSPTDWVVDGASTWNLVAAPAVGEARRLVLTLQDYCRQRINLTGNEMLLGAILDAGVLSVSVSIANMTAASVLYVGVKLLDVGLVEMVTAGGYVKTTGTSETDGYTTFTFAMKIPPCRTAGGVATAARTTLMAAIKHIGIEIINPDGPGTPKSVSIAGAYLGAGMPPLLPMANRDYYEFLSRDGGLQSAMRGDLEVGGFDVNNARDIEATRDVTIGRDLSVDRDLVVTEDATVTGRTTLDGGFDAGADSDMGLNKLTGIPLVNDPTAAVPNNKFGTTVTDYSDRYGDIVGTSLSIVIAGTTWYFPADANPAGPTPKCGCTCTCTCACTCACNCTCTGTRWN